MDDTVTEEKTRLTARERVALVLIAFAAAAALAYGWHLFWFLTDDAYIAFRYVANSLAGYGYVWNAPPFRPVEGYTSFLWVVLLDLTWRFTGVQPPDAANVLSLVFAGLTLLLGAALVWWYPWSERLRPGRVAILGLVLAGVLTNRTFLAWTSSGLETALFNFCLTLWIAACLVMPLERPRSALMIATAALLTYLTRPDGVLVVAASALLLPVAWRVGASRTTSRPAAWLALAPLLGVPLHLLWRHSTYGEWLPNTYYAKTIAGRLWWESGLRYCLSFVIEYALWVWLLVLCASLLAFALRLRRPGTRRQWAALRMPRAWARLAVIAVLLTDFLYYTVVVGGDHFEFRVYSHLILLAFVTLPWMLDRLQAPIFAVMAVLVAFIVLSWPIPWTHWVLSQQYVTRAETQYLRVPVATAMARAIPALPAALLEPVRTYDELQSWLILHSVGMRHQEHKVFQRDLVRRYPARVTLPACALSGSYPVARASSVGVVGWVLSNVSVIDEFGLNDWVIARHAETSAFSSMAHERLAPPGYAECFLPNVRLSEGYAIASCRPVPLTPERIGACERGFAQQVGTTQPDWASAALPVSFPGEPRRLMPAPSEGAILLPWIAR